VLGVAARHQRFDELSIPRVAAWGALGGLLVSFIPLAMVGLGLASANVSIWKITAILAGPLTMGSSIAAAATLALARKAEDRRVVEASRELSEIGLTDDEKRELLGSSD
jgi:hypothetical protein